MHVFTYGSLMFPTVWTRVVAGCYRSTAASLAGFRRWRVRGEDYPCLERSEGDGGDGGHHAPVAGMLYLDVSPGDIAALDAFEGVDYRRIEVPVTVGDGQAGAASVGATLLAQTYLFIARARIEPAEWDPAEFERDRLERFLRTYPPAQVRGS
jgi:gamma-glutamylcyclotransferase (GGCT)/AIG2-like uncharacterized protein YtfP